MCDYGLLAARLKRQTWSASADSADIVNVQAKGHAACQTTEGRESWHANVRQDDTRLIKGHTWEAVAPGLCILVTPHNIDR